MFIGLVEDDPLIAKSVGTAIREAGHQCNWVGDAEEAAINDTLRKSDVVILDVMLPKLSGLEILQHARAAGIRTPVILLTARPAKLGERSACFVCPRSDSASLRAMTKQ